ncbi:MAG TPA: hypothetical protein VFV01_47960 [Spirillospora sp.]|nr:hypothetical protein [Spirillospora sp.]
MKEKFGNLAPGTVIEVEDGSWLVETPVRPSLFGGSFGRLAVNARHMWTGEVMTFSADGADDEVEVWEL